MLLAAECSVAVANSLNPVKDIANWVTPGDHGTGVVELIKRLLENDLYDLDKKLKRHYLELGIRSDTSVFKISPYRSGILLTGTSGAGKTTFTIAFLESLIAQQYQFCLVDPEGDYLDLPEIATLGDTEHAPAIEQIIKLLENPLQSVVICLLAIPMDDRPAFLKKLLAAVLELRTSSGHPHWLILDEAHHLIPSEEPSSLFNISADFNNFMLITTGPDLLNRSVLEKTGMIIAIGEKPGEAFRKYAEICKLQPPEVALSGLQKGEALVWENAAGTAPFLIRSAAPRHLTQRHKRKYSKGDMGPDSFYFKGPEGKLNLKAQNLMAFIQIAEGLDDETWMYHLKRKDYSKWFRHFVNDNELAAFTEKIEGKENDPEASRKNIRKLIEEKYTGPAE
jgi:GTPase SAR1 family protein